MKETTIEKWKILAAYQLVDRAMKLKSGLPSAVRQHLYAAHYELTKAKENLYT